MKNVKSGHKQPIVCLDAGHYGKYNRSPVVPRYYESSAMWTLHNYLATALEGYGIQVKKTRTNQEKDMSLTTRGRASKGCDLFLSLHSNACGTEKVDRVEGIHLVEDGGSNIDEASRTVAKLLAAAVTKTMGTADEAKTYSRKHSGDRDGNGKKDDDYYGVLYGAHQVGTAGVILEHSFHTNTKAAKWLLKDANLKKLAQAEAAVIAEYYGMTAAETTGSTEPQKKTEAPASALIDTAKSFNKAKAGTYAVKSPDGTLNLRAGAAADRRLIEAMKNGSTVKCYGYYTGDWLYVVSAAGNTGYCHGKYLTKV